MTHRNRRVIAMRALAGLAPALMLLASPALAQETPYAKINAAAAADAVTVQPLRGGVSLLQGSGGNMVALASPKGLFMVDDGISVSQAKIEAALREVGPGPINYVVNTHWHWDHADGNAWAHGDGATLIGQANTAKHLTQTIRVEEWGHTFAPEPAGGRIALMVDEEKTMGYGGDTIRMRHYPPSHTDGDLSVYFKKGDMAREAERLLEETGWLPEPLRTPGLDDIEPAATEGEEPTVELPAFLADDPAGGDGESDAELPVAAE